MDRPIAGEPPNSKLHNKNEVQQTGSSALNHAPGNSLTKDLDTKRKLCSNRTGLDIWGENSSKTSTRGITQILERNDNIHVPIEEPMETSIISSNFTISKLCAASKTEATFAKRKPTPVTR